MIDKSTSRGGGKGRPPGGGRGGFGKGGGGKGRPPRGPNNRGPSDRPRSERGPSDRVRSDRGSARGGFKASGDRFRRREDRGRSGPIKQNFTATPRVEKAGERIAKVMARVGLCSRREAEDWILAGRVSVNGELLKSPARDVTLQDEILVDGEKLPTRERTRLFLYHKERGLVTTARDPEGRPTVFAALPPGLPRVITVGRLDINTEGLLLLTNDGGLARVLALPETGWLRRYRVRCFGEIDQPTLDTLRKGITVDGMHYGPIEATLDREKGDNVWLTLGLREGKNREVKRVLEHLGLQVNRLIRVSFGPFQLGDLPEGAVEEVRSSFLKDQLGPALIEESGADFDAPVFVYDTEPQEDDEQENIAAQRERDREAKRAERSLVPPERRGRPDRARGKGPRPSRPAEPMRGGQRKPFEKDKQPDDARPPRRHPTEPKRSIWRADDLEAGPSGPKKTRSPRRGADPVAARAESAERAHHRAGRVTSASGRSVKVEKILSTRVRNDAPWDMERTNKENAKSGTRERKPRSDFSSDRKTERRPDRAAGSRSRDDAPRASRPQREGRPSRDGASLRPQREGRSSRDGAPSRSSRPPRDGGPSRSPRGGGGKPPRSGGAGGNRRPPRGRS